MEKITQENLHKQTNTIRYKGYKKDFFGLGSRLKKDKTIDRLKSKINGRKGSLINHKMKEELMTFIEQHKQDSWIGLKGIVEQIQSLGGSGIIDYVSTQQKITENIYKTYDTEYDYQDRREELNNSNIMDESEDITDWLNQIHTIIPMSNEEFLKVCKTNPQNSWEIYWREIGKDKYESEVK
jgi:hypothetical protein